MPGMPLLQERSQKGKGSVRITSLNRQNPGKRGSVFMDEQQEKMILLTGKKAEQMIKKAAVITGVILMLLFFGCAKAGTEETPVTAESGITEFYFSYDNFSGDQFRLDARAESFKDSNVVLAIEKRIGPMNYTGKSKKGLIRLSEEEGKTLMELLHRYDDRIREWSQLKRSGSTASPSRSLMIWEDGQRYVVSFDTVFPETNPPEEDIMYYELFTFFNGLLKNKPGWEEVVGVELKDPRNNPAYYERTVMTFGHEVPLKEGTGTYHADGRGATLDYGDDLWWQMEGFTGTWEIGSSDAYPDLENSSDTCTMTVEEDGSVTLVLDSETWKGKVSDKRIYKESISMTMENEGEQRVFHADNIIDDSYEELLLSCYPGPVPEPQFEPVDLILIKKPDAKGEEENETSES